MIPSLRLSPPLEVYSITGGKQFHPLAPPHSPFGCGEKVGGGATFCVFLSAGCKSIRWKGVCVLGGKNGGRACVFLGSLCRARTGSSQVLPGSGGRDGGVEDLSNRGKPLWIFKVGACGSEVVACICCCHARLSMDEAPAMVMVDFISGIIGLTFS